MHKYIYTLFMLVHSRFTDSMAFKINVDSVVSELFCDDFTESDWINIIIETELIYSFEFPFENFDKPDLTIQDFAKVMEQLPIVPPESYLEFLEIKMNQRYDVPRLLALQKGAQPRKPGEMEEMEKSVKKGRERLLQFTENAA